jgi:alpha-methylacyl-CoA racemase
MSSSGPLAGIRVLEIESIGPGPYASMLLADLGANVLRISRPDAEPSRINPVLDRGRAGSIALDMKSPDGRAKLLELAEKADVMIEGYRPGVMERLGIGPDVCLARNPCLIFGRITGWGQGGPLAHTAGHDINYISLTGALHAVGTADSGPVPPLNLVGDFGGGGMLLALGVLAALLETRLSGKGQIVDAAMVDGASSLMAMMHGFRAMGAWPAPRHGNLLDGSAYFYRCYACKDGRWVAVGAIEPKFRCELFEKLGLADEAKQLLAASPQDRAVTERIDAIFKTRGRDEWAALFEGSDACVTPVLSMEEAPRHAQIHARETLTILEGAAHPIPAPRFSRTSLPPPASARLQKSELLTAWGISPG